jgi:hypothetical protein
LQSFRIDATHNRLMKNILSEKSTIESVAGHPLTTGLTAVATGTAAVLYPDFAPVLGVIPPLIQTLAGERHNERVRFVLISLGEELASMQNALRDITDSQYQFASEAVGHMLSTVKQEKLEYLRRAVVNNMHNPELTSEWGERLSRLIRDISLAETQTLVELFKNDAVCIADAQPDALPQGMYCAITGSPEARNVEGLIQLGLLQSHAATWDFTRYEWTPLVAKLIALLQPLPRPLKKDSGQGAP